MQLLPTQKNQIFEAIIQRGHSPVDFELYSVDDEEGGYYNVGWGIRFLKNKAFIFQNSDTGCIISPLRRTCIISIVNFHCSKLEKFPTLRRIFIRCF